MARLSHSFKESGKRFRDVHLRARWWNYEKEGHYFITFCTNSRIHFLGQIKDGTFFPSPLGQIAETIWHEIPKQFSFIELGSFVVMPDHIHGILTIKKNWELDKIEKKKEREREDKREGVGSGLIPTPQKENGELLQSIPKKGTGGITGIHNPMTKENISRVLRWYKGRCTFEMRKIRPDFSWQSKFHDRIIRDYNEHFRIEKYILNNPRNWGKKKKFHNL